MSTPSQEGESKQQMASNDTGSFAIQHLSPGLLAEIFVHCLEEATHVSNCISDCPLLLCMVCSSWRSLALHTPRLWSSLYLSPCRTPSDVGRFVEHVHSWIQRSGSLPLRLKFDLTMYEGEDREDLIDIILTVCLQYALRWQTIDLDLDIVSSKSLQKLSQNPIHAPLLHTFILRERFHQELLPFEISFPALTEFSSSLVTRSLTNINIPWNLLTHLDICAGLSYTTALEIFHYCPKLVHYTMIFIDLRSDSDHPVELEHGPLIRHDGLSYFSLTFSYICKSFFNRLVLPGLHHFKLGRIIIHDYVGVYSYHRELLALFTRSGCKLTALELHDPAFSPDMLLWHESCQTLQAISFKSYYNPVFNDEALFHLTRVPEREDGLLCPVLEQLELEFVDHMTPGLLAKMILSRRSSHNPGTTLNHVNINTLYTTLHIKDQTILDKVDCRVCNVIVTSHFSSSDDNEDDNDNGDES